MFLLCFVQLLLFYHLPVALPVPKERGGGERIGRGGDLGGRGGDRPVKALYCSCSHTRSHGSAWERVRLRHAA